MGERRTDPDQSKGLPSAIEGELTRIRRRVHRFLALDGVLAGLGAAGALGIPATLVLDLAGGPLIAGAALGACAGVGVAFAEFRTRRLDRLRAAMVLDRLLDGKDRFASAVSFASQGTSSTLHVAQRTEAGVFLARKGSVPEAPRPSARAPRYWVLAALATGFFVPFHAVWPAMIAALREAAGIEEEPRSLEEIAEEAEVLRRALAQDPTRRVDREINRLEHELERERGRTERARAEALERAAAAIERAMGRTPEAPSQADTAADEGTAEQNAMQSVEGAAPEGASDRLRDAWEQAQAAREAWQQAARSESATSEEVARLQSEAQRAQMEALELADQERSWRQARGETSEPEGGDEPQRSEEEQLTNAIDRLDQALAELDPTDDEDRVPSAEVGRGLEQASGELDEHTPDTARALAEAAQARDRGDTEAMDSALERARQSLRREAGRETRELANARRRLEQLHDEVAEQAGRGAREQLAQAGQAQAGQAQAGQGQPQAGQGQPQAGQAQAGQGQAQAGQGQAQAGQGQAQAGQGQAQAGQGQAQAGQGQAQAGQGQAQAGQGQAQAQAGPPSGQEGQGQAGQEAGQEGGAASSRGWGSASGGDPGLAAARAAGASTEGIQVDPGTRAGQPAELGAEPDPLGLLPGAARMAGRGGARMDGLSTGHPGEGSGVVGGSGADAPRISGGTSVPGSLRAYVQRYLRALESAGNEDSNPR